ncbi:MAG: hypothetical protein LBI55_00900 [Oscillospiraceae bacterium]|jgi:acyl-ACP thioesterase|nr:hypothetical protein [Oscillospiraceae bacterium]
MGEVYKKTIGVTSKDCDMENRMSASSMLKNNQQISINHCKDFDIEDDYYRKNGIAFLVAQVSMEFHGSPKNDDVINVISEPFKPLRAIHYRYTEFFNANNNYCWASVDSRWILVDVKKKQIIRNPPPELVFKNASESIKKHPHKLFRFSEVIFVGEETATYSRCDLYHHLNNTEYANIIFDHLPIEILKRRFPSRVFISYRKEILLGKRFGIFMGNFENRYYILGSDEKEKYFEANVIF